MPAGAVLYEITRRERFDPAAFEAAKPALRAELLDQRRDALRTSILDQIGDRLQSQGRLEINQQLVTRLDQ